MKKWYDEECMMVMFPIMEAVRSGGDLENIGGDGKYTKTFAYAE